MRVATYRGTTVYMYALDPLAVLGVRELVAASHVWLVHWVCGPSLESFITSEGGLQNGSGAEIR